MPRRFVEIAAASLILTGCGYVGEPVPPSLNLAPPIADLRVVEYGERLLIDFSIPKLTTDGIELRNIDQVDLRIGPGGTPWEVNRWAQAAKAVAVANKEPGPVHVETPASEWEGKEIVASVRIVNRKGRASEWSNLVVMRVQPPLAKPTGLKPDNDPAGVKLTWVSAAPKFRVFRKAPDQEQAVLLGTAEKPFYVDSAAAIGKKYEYYVQAIHDSAESEVTAMVSFTPKDVFAPAAPAGLSGVPGAGTVELVWDRNTEPDLRGYRVYRAAPGGEMAVLAEFVEAPAFSDRQVDSGKVYKYAVAATDQAGNESRPSATVEVTAP